MNKHNKRTIEINVAIDGQIKIEAVSFQGSDCEQATRFLEEALGIAGRKTKKPEYYQHSRRQTKQRIGS